MKWTDIWIIIPCVLGLSLCYVIIMTLVLLRQRFWPGFSEISYEIFKVLRSYGLDPQETLYWAFGEDYEILAKELWMVRWNERHGNLFIIKSSDRFEDFYIKIAEAYKNELESRKAK